LLSEKAELNLQVNAFAKRKAEIVLDKIGMSMADAIDFYLYALALKGDVWFKNDLPPCPPELNADLMTPEELHAELQKGFDEAKAGRLHPIEEVLAEHRAKYGTISSNKSSD